jgi:hypothetical protein
MGLNARAKCRVVQVIIRMNSVRISVIPRSKIKSVRALMGLLMCYGRFLEKLDEAACCWRAHLQTSAHSYR